MWTAPGDPHPILIPEALPQCQQPSAKQGEETQGRNGPPAALSTSLACSTGTIFTALEEPACGHPQIAVDWRKQSDIYFLGHVLTESQEPRLN